jgi:hypothetical protein
MRRNGLLLAAAIIVVANAFVLVGVARNRSGQPRETIQLTERELPMDPRGKEDTGVSLRLRWEQLYSSIPSSYPWLDRAKLESVGFDCEGAFRDSKRRPLDRPAFLVLEYNGAAWEEWQRSIDETKTVRGFDKAAQSRLFVIDAAKRPESLLSQYADRRKYLIVRGVVRLFVNNWDPKTQKPGPYRLQPSVAELLPSIIHVPLPLSTTMANRSANTAAADFHYAVTLSYGSRFEPWVANIE